MLKKIFTRLGGKKHPAGARKNRAEMLLHYLEENQSLVLDGDGLLKIGMSRKQAFQTVYDLVVRENIQMRAETDGRVVVMTNAEYIRQMEDRARETWSQDAGLKTETAKNVVDLAPLEDDDAEFFAAAEGKSLPERGREPWISLENAIFDFD